MKKIVLFFAVALAGVSCSPKVITNISTQLPPLSPKGTLIAVANNMSVMPEGAQYTGTLEVTDSGFSPECSYDQVVELAKRTALKKGGNFLNISHHKAPDAACPCHRIVASIYHIDG